MPLTPQSPHDTLKTPSCQQQSHLLGIQPVRAKDQHKPGSNTKQDKTICRYLIALINRRSGHPPLPPDPHQPFHFKLGKLSTQQHQQRGHLLQALATSAGAQYFSTLAHSSCLTLLCLPAAALAALPSIPRPISSPQRFRFWVDYQALSHPGR
jgi:hypothetical protein